MPKKPTPTGRANAPIRGAERGRALQRCRRAAPRGQRPLQPGADQLGAGRERDADEHQRKHGDEHQAVDGIGLWDEHAERVAPPGDDRRAPYSTPATSMIAAERRAIRRAACSVRPAASIDRGHTAAERRS